MNLPGKQKIHVLGSSPRRGLNLHSPTFQQSSLTTRVWARPGMANLQHRRHKWYKWPLSMAHSRLGRGQEAQQQLGQEAEQQTRKGKGIALALGEGMGKNL